MYGRQWRRYLLLKSLKLDLHVLKLLPGVQKLLTLLLSANEAERLAIGKRLETLSFTLKNHMPKGFCIYFF